MTGPVKSRPYRSTRRAAGAAATRAAVLSAARTLFAERGYAGTTVAAVAREAGVAVDTVYTSVGRKPQLLLALVDEALAGRGRAAPAGEPTAADDRDYVRALLAAPTASAKLETYAEAVSQVLPDVVPLVAALRQAAVTDDDARAALHQLGERRYANMLRFVADLRATGELRSGLDDEDAALLVWSTNAPEHVELLLARGLSWPQVGQHLADLWSRTLLEPPDS